MDKTPDYDDRKREEYKKLRTDFEKEIQKPYGIRNDRRMLDMGDELLRHVETFSAFIPTSSLASLRGTGRGET